MSTTIVYRSNSLQGARNDSSAGAEAESKAPASGTISKPA